MRLSTKSRFAVDAMVDLALREQAGPVALAAIAGRQHISLSYLEQLVARLRRAGLLESTRGPGGGYTLARPVEQISVADMVCAIDELEPPQNTVSGALWADLDAVMLRHMATISLRSLVEDQRAKGVVVELPASRRKEAAAAAAARPPKTSAPNSVFAFGRSFVK